MKIKTRDEELVTAFLNGNEDAFEELMRIYQRDLFYFVKSLILSSEDARDITQKAFIIAFRRLKRLKERKKFRSWLLRIAANLTKDHLRRIKTEVEFSEWMEPDNSNMPEKSAIEKEMGNNVRWAMELLPVRQQQVVKLRIFQELSFSEIARLIGIKEATARTNFHFGIKNLRNHLNRRGINNGV